jgi:biopolymer transport protein ExbD
MKRSLKIQIVVLAAITCVACTKLETPRGGTQEDRATVDQEESETAQTCQVHYRSVDREAQCNEVGSFMLSELHIPTRARIVVRPSRTANYEQVGRMLQSLQNSGYASIEFPRH